MDPSANGYGRLSTTGLGNREPLHERESQAIVRFPSVSDASDRGHIRPGVRERPHDTGFMRSIYRGTLLPERATITDERRLYSSCQNVIR